MNPKQAIADSFRNEMLREFSEFKSAPELLDKLGRIVFESDREFAQKHATAFGLLDQFPTWDMLQPQTKARWMRMGTKIAHLLIDDHSDIIDAMRFKVINASQRPSTAALRDIEIAVDSD